MPPSATTTEPFTLRCQDGTTCTGLASIPSQSPRAPSADSHLPLMIGLHGGSCNSTYFSFPPAHSALALASHTGIPFIALDRPSYGGTTPIPSSIDTDFWTATAQRLHAQILPLLWTHFGLPAGCSGVVLDAHSYGVPPTILTAGFHADDAKPAYPLVGLILSGWGIEPSNAPPTVPEDGDGDGDTIEFSAETKRVMMLSEPSHDCCPPSTADEMLAQHNRLNSPMPKAERAMIFTWLADGVAAEMCGRVEVPVLHTMGERDWLLKVSEELVERFAGLFGKAAVETRVVRSGPHALEWGWGGKGYVLVCLGWACEVVNV